MMSMTYEDSDRTNNHSKSSTKNAPVFKYGNETTESDTRRPIMLIQ